MSGYLKLSDGRTVALRDGLVIGRGKNCDIVLDDTKASRRHAKVIVEGGVVEVADLGSSNGSLLNGRPIEQRMMRAGDELQIGKTTLTLHDGEIPGSKQPGARQSGSASPASPGSAAGGWDDDELDFGGGGGSAAASAAPAEPPRPAPASPPPASPVPAPTPSPATPAEPAPASPAFDDDDELFGSDDPAPAASPAAAPRPAPAPQPTPAPQPKKQNVVEFADEIVEVKKPTAKPRSQPGASKADDGPVVESRQKVLQFSKNANSKGVLGDDVGQMSGGMRGLVFVLVIAGMGGIVWLVMNAVR